MRVESKTGRPRWPIALCLMLLGSSHALGQQPNFKRTASEKSLGAVGPVDLSKRSLTKPDFWISPDGRRFAYAIENGFVVDGETKKYELGVEPDSFTFSPDSRKTAYVAKVVRGESGGRNEVLVVDGQEAKTLYSNVDAPLFSPDSRHVACIARLRASTFEHLLLIDEREVGLADASFNWEVAFTPDSRRVLYAVEVNDRYVMREESVDGSEPQVVRTHGPAVLTNNFFFGPAGQVGYIAHDADRKTLVVYDGKEESLRFKEIDKDTVVLSDDGKHLGYVAEPESFRDVVVVDGRPSKVYGAFDGDIVEDSLTFSPDGRRWGYAVENGRKSHAVIDGKESRQYDAVGTIVFSPDGQHVAHLAAANGLVFSVVDGRQGAGYEDRGAPVFSPDNKSAAFWAEARNRQFVVHNGQPQKAYDEVGSPAFSADGSRLAYLARAGEKWLLVDGGKEQKPYDDIKGRLYFSDDSRHLAAVVFDGNQQMVVLNGFEGNRYDTIVTVGGAKVFFDSPNRIHYLADKGGELFLVEETLQE